MYSIFFFFSSRRRHTRSLRDWSSDVCSSDLVAEVGRRLHEAGKAVVLYGACDEELRPPYRSEEHTSELQSRRDLVCRLLLEKKKKKKKKKKERNTKQKTKEKKINENHRESNR